MAPIFQLFERFGTTEITEKCYGTILGARAVPPVL